jgi:hypothetical protein
MNHVPAVVISTIAPNGSAALPFVIPSEAEGSAVRSFGPNEFVIPTGANPGIRVSAVEEPPVRSASTQLQPEGGSELEMQEPVKIHLSGALPALQPFPR